MSRPLAGANAPDVLERGWLRYVNSVDEFASLGPFDVVLVDGRCRAGSALKSLCYMHGNSTLMVHDWKTNYAEVVLKHFELRQVLQTLAVLSPLPGAAGDCSSYLDHVGDWE